MTFSNARIHLETRQKLTDRHYQELSHSGQWLPRSHLMHWWKRGRRKGARHLIFKRAWKLREKSSAASTRKSCKEILKIQGEDNQWTTETWCMSNAQRKQDKPQGAHWYLRVVKTITGPEGCFAKVWVRNAILNRNFHAWTVMRVLYIYKNVLKPNEYKQIHVIASRPSPSSASPVIDKKRNKSCIK